MGKTQQMKRLRVLMLSDGRPGHYHLSEGVILALGRNHDIALERRNITRASWIPAKLLRQMLDLGLPPATVLRLGYGLAADALPASDLVISAGGNTLAANLAASRRLGATNIFIGSLRGAAPEHFSLVISSYARHDGLPRHLVTLKPSPTDPDSFARPATAPRFGPDQAPQRIGLLIGGDSGLFRFTATDWARLQAFITQMSSATGARWLISTSPRTPAEAADGFAALAANAKSQTAAGSPNEGGAMIEEFIDFRVSGPGTLPRIFARADVIFCTEDSSSMISEAIAARLPVLGIEPENCAYEDREQEYREYLRANRWCASMPIAELTPKRVLASLADLRPLRQNHVDLLAAQLVERLPHLLGRQGTRTMTDGNDDGRRRAN